LIDDGFDRKASCFKIRRRKLVVFAPTLRDVNSPFLKNRVEVSKEVDESCFLRRVALELLVVEGKIHSLDIEFESWWRFVRYLEAALQEYDRELILFLGGKPEFEIFILFYFPKRLL